jgi:hypothetical protein
VTHVLLPVVALARRRDLAEPIGLALVAKAAGRGQRTIAGELGLPPTTVGAGCAGSPPGRGAAAREGGPSLRRTTPKNPVRLAAGEPAGSRPIGPLGVNQCPEELPRPSRVSRERVSSYDPKAA